MRFTRRNKREAVDGDDNGNAELGRVGDVALKVAGTLLNEFQILKKKQQNQILTTTISL